MAAPELLLSAADGKLQGDSYVVLQRMSCSRLARHEAPAVSVRARRALAAVPELGHSGPAAADTRPVDAVPKHTQASLRVASMHSHLEVARRIEVQAADAPLGSLDMAPDALSEESHVARTLGRPTMAVLGHMALVRPAADSTDLMTVCGLRLGPLVICSAIHCHSCGVHLVHSAVSQQAGLARPFEPRLVDFGAMIGLVALASSDQ